MRESEPPPAPPKVKHWGSYKYQLLDPKGTVLARSPTREAAVQTAAAIHGHLYLKRNSDDWELYDDEGVLVAIVTAK